jgi:hypothetical protein
MEDLRTFKFVRHHHVNHTRIHDSSSLDVIILDAFQSMNA